MSNHFVYIVVECNKILLQLHWLCEYFLLLYFEGTWSDVSLVFNLESFLFFCSASNCKGFFLLPANRGQYLIKDTYIISNPVILIVRLCALSCNTYEFICQTFC